MVHSKQTTIIIILAGIILAIGIIGAVTMQLMAAAVLIVLIATGALLVKFLSGRIEVRDEHPGEGEAIVAAVLFALIGMAGAQWLIQAAALAALFMILLSLWRIEKRLGTPGNR